MVTLLSIACCQIVSNVGIVFELIARRAFVWDPFKFRCPSVRSASVRPSVRPDIFRFSARRRALATRFLDQSVQAKTSNSQNPKIQNDVSEVGIGTYFRFFYETFFKKFPGYVSMKRWVLPQLGSYTQCKTKTKSCFSTYKHFKHVRLTQPEQI